MRPRPHVLEKRSFFSVFEKIHVHSSRIVFTYPQENAYKMEIEYHALQGMRYMIYNIYLSYLKTSVFSSFRKTKTISRCFHMHFRWSSSPDTCKW